MCVHEDACVSSLAWLLEVILDNDFQQNGVIRIDVASTRNNGSRFGFVRIIREIELEKDLVLDDFESFVRSFAEEDSSDVENSLINDGYGWGIGWSFEFRLDHVDLGRYDEKFLDERWFGVRILGKLLGHLCPSSAPLVLSPWNWLKVYSDEENEKNSHRVFLPQSRCYGTRRKAEEKSKQSRVTRYETQYYLNSLLMKMVTTTVLVMVLWESNIGSLIVARGKRESKLYMTHPKISKSIFNAVDNDDMTELWHKRLGHMSEKGMSILYKKNVLSGAHDINLKKCSHCLARKQTRLAFVTKDQVLDVFKQFHALVERQTGKKLKCIRTDNGGEYIGPFDAYCREHGIQHQKTPPKTPQLNDLAERMDRTLVERVRCLLSHAGLPASFWGEALNTAVHVINLTPCVPLRFDVPDRVWSGKDVSYYHLRVFGCKASVHIPKDERSKLDNDEETRDADDVVCSQEQPNLDEDVHPELQYPDMQPFIRLGDLLRSSSFTLIRNLHGETEVFKLRGMESDYVCRTSKKLYGVLSSTEERGTVFISNLDCKRYVWHCLQTEAEYRDATEACKELLWLKMFLQELGFKQQRYAVLCDNQNWSCLNLNKVHTDDNASDMLTKAVARENLKAWKSIFIPGQIASYLVIFFLSCSLIVAIYLDA
ncbi:putative RNA-directed DNA polymerase [Tanacetum coccineum]|uniref:RNA-directed DNA polymerase n=1 Tax=Tanacetum coccineum TaxID=301880 RepID=A0ABQ4XVZ0_9ASTR